MKPISLGASIRRTRVKWSLLSLRDLSNFAEEFRRRRLIEARSYSSLADRFEYSHNPDPGHFGGVFRNIKADSDMRLSAQIIDFVGLQTPEYRVQCARIVQISVDQPKSGL